MPNIDHRRGGDTYEGIAHPERIRRRDRGADEPRARPLRKPPRYQSEEFRCRQCKTMVGPPLSGGRHRNHCPLCLYSRHVDDRYPGDRASECRSLMVPVGSFFRRNGEQVIVHRCLGCGVARNCRVAADDSIPACLRLPLVGQATPVERDEEEAIA